MPSLLFEPRPQLIDSNGEVIVNGYWYFCEAGTSTPKDTYDDYALTTPNPNPVRTGIDGRPKDNVNIFLSGAYKVDARDATNTSLPGYPVDNVISANDFDFTGLTASIADLNSTTTTAIPITSNYPVTLTDRGKNILANATSASIDVTLLPVATAGDGYKITIKKVDNSKNIVTVKTNASETVDVRSEYILHDYNDFIEVLCDGSNWKIVAAQIRGTLTVITGATTVALTDNTKMFLCDASGASFNVALPAAAVVGKGFQVSFKKTDATANSINIQADGLETIDGKTSLGLAAQYEFYEIKSDGDNWYIVNETIEAGGARTGDVRTSFRSISEMPTWVIMNDGTIGNASSGASTRANDDTRELFVLLWTNVIDAWAPVVTGRGASALDDFNANKKLTLPRSFGRALCAAGSGAGLTPRALGEYLGEETHVLTIPELAAHSHVPLAPGTAFLANGAGTGNAPAGSDIGSVASTALTGSNTAHNNMQPSSFMNVYIKL